MDKGAPRLAVCVCTYRRLRLLQRLLEDLARHRLQPDALIVVDGDPTSGEVLTALEALQSKWKIVYVPSNHANLPYQRYLGWRMAAGYRYILYLDDDLRLSRPDVLERLLRPFEWSGRGVVATTAEIETPDNTGAAHLGGSRWANALLASLVSRCGVSRGAVLGELTPAGDRMPIRSTGRDYASVSWLRGGVMAFRMSTLSQECFSEALIAAYERKLGKGEDTVLARRVAGRGELVIALGSGILHPNAEPPAAYATEPRARGYAVACSRRLINDNFRGGRRPELSDRLALLRSYAGTVFANWVLALCSLRRNEVAYAWGYTLGALRGLVQEPTARNLTPRIDWWADAERAVYSARKLRGGESI